MSDNTQFRIVRSDSFWWDEPLVFVNNNTLYDNMGHIMASADYHIFPADRRYIPLIVKDHLGVPKGIHFNGRVYWLHIVCDHIDWWYNGGVITLTQRDLIGDILRFLVHEDLAWDLSYFWPNVFMPYVSNNRLQSCNLGTFLDQFPSDPYIIDLVNDSETVETDALTSLASFDCDSDNFDWEGLNDSFIDLFN